MEAAQALIVSCGSLYTATLSKDGGEVTGAFRELIARQDTEWRWL